MPDRKYRPLIDALKKYYSKEDKMLKRGQRVRLLIEPGDPEPAWVGTILGVVPGSEDRSDKVVYFVHWDGQELRDRRYPGEMELLERQESINK